MLLILKKLDRFSLLLVDSNFEEQPDDEENSHSQVIAADKQIDLQGEQLDFRTGEYFYQRDLRRGPLFECEPEYPMSLRYHAYK